MNKPVTYNKAVIPNSTTAIAELQNNDNQAVVNSTIMIAELRTASPWAWPLTKPLPKCLRNSRKALPDIKKLLLKTLYKKSLVLF